ncbi:hypothetical protein IE4771_CH04419 [Rhizobium etli bv. mimosae str. IE4771]|uniref:Uncharacterized protein n=1 Tax=Rhizobium etli bv. mimosae str. IE4771 TaxID=1432050 RepID=A0A060I6R6_RHIET|nr:hypothetical protein IE4771_CH04419 [Rhizobium sp. IE4771]
MMAVKKKFESDRIDWKRWTRPVADCLKFCSERMMKVRPVSGRFDVFNESSARAA